MTAGTRGVLRAPLDLIVAGDKVLFARPLFNLDGSRVVGSELAEGAINGSGQMHLASRWGLLGRTAEAQYDGRLGAHGGTLIGVQTWSGEGKPVTRVCVAAVVPAPTAERSSGE